MSANQTIKEMGQVRLREQIIRKKKALAEIKLRPKT